MKPRTEAGRVRLDLTTLPLHPLLLSLYAVLAMLAANIHELDASDAYRSAGVAIGLAVILSLAWWLVVRNGPKAGVLASLCLLAFYSYGHAYTLLKTASIGAVLIGRHRFLVPALGILLVLGIIVVLRGRGHLGGLTRLLNLMTAVALLGPTFTIGSALWEERTVWQAEGMPTRTLSGREPTPAETLPDIYYILVDAYPGSDLLRERFGYDNSAFEEGLTERGFYVARQSHSNYAHTALSTASSLNMDYLSDVPVDLDRGHYPENVQEAILHSVVRRDLEALGYSVVAFPSGYAPTSLSDADVYLTPDMTAIDRPGQEGAFNAFEVMLFSSTAGRLLLDLDTRAEAPLRTFLAEKLAVREKLFQREAILSALDHLTRAAEIPGPKFVFAHIILPHRPYFFTADGGEQMPIGLITYEDLAQSLTWQQEVPRYLGQLEYVNTRLGEVLDAILAGSATPPIILLQSDHGPDLGIDYEHPDADDLESRLSILSAYHLPSECEGGLRPGISPVNSFRIVFNCIQGPTYDLLEDRSYYNPIGQPSPGRLRPVEEWLQAGAP
jgi:hypothetical protein